MAPLSLLEGTPSNVGFDSKSPMKGRVALMLSILRMALVGVEKSELVEKMDGSYIMLNEVLLFLCQYGLVSEERNKETGEITFRTTRAGLDLLESTRYFRDLEEVKRAFEEQLLAA
jgi:predicted transcriptional regulator